MGLCVAYRQKRYWPRRALSWAEAKAAGHSHDFVGRDISKRPTGKPQSKKKTATSVRSLSNEGDSPSSSEISDRRATRLKTEIAPDPL